MLSHLVAFPGLGAEAASPPAVFPLCASLIRTVIGFRAHPSPHLQRSSFQMSFHSEVPMGYAI